MQNLRASKTFRYPYVLTVKKMKNELKNMIKKQLIIDLNLFFFEHSVIKSLYPSAITTKIK